MSNIKLQHQKKIKIQTSKTYFSKAEKQRSEREKKLPDKSPVLLILYLCGILGIMNAANTAINIPEVYFIIAEIAVIALSTVMWYIYVYHNRYFNYIVVPLTAISVLLVFINSNSISGSLMSLTTGSSREMSPFLIAVAAYMAVLLVFTLEFVSRNHSIMFVICTAILIFGANIGISFSLVDVVLITTFQFGFIVLNMNSSSSRRTLVTKKHRKIGFLSTVIAAGVIVVCFLPAFIAENIFERDILSHVYYVDGIIQDIISRLTQNNEGGILDGSVNRGNLRQTGEKMFDADVLEVPDDRLYLKAFVGSDYDGKDWQNAYEFFAQDVGLYSSDSGILYSPYYTPDYDDIDDDYFQNNRRRVGNYYREPFMNNLIELSVRDFFDDLNEMLEQHGIKQEAEYVQGNNYQLYVSCTDNVWVEIDYNEKTVEYLQGAGDAKYFTTDENELPNYPEQLLTKSSDPVNAIYSDGIVTNFSVENDFNRVCISPLQNKYINILVPYYSEKSISDIQQSIGTISFTYSTSFGNTDRVKKLYADKNWGGSKSYKNFIDNYITEIQNEYTYVPYGNMPQLTELCSTTDLTELNDITTFILYTLQTKATYSKTPGNVPYNKDTIEYFLFENHKGYCVHFATAAALMYRMYGIPSRYVTGYAIDKDTFRAIENPGETSNDYKYKAEVTDYLAHAWVEIFLEDYGWVPVEVTPTANGDMIAEYPGYDKNEMDRIMKKYGWTFSNDTSSASDDTTSANDDSELSPEQIMLIATLCIICAVIIFIPIRRKFILHRRSTMQCKQLFDRLIRALHFSGLLTGLNGSEEDFAKLLSEAVPVIDEDSSIKLIEIMQADNFSENTASSDDTEFVRKIYEESAEYLYRKIKWYKKPVFKLIKCFC